MDSDVEEISIGISFPLPFRVLVLAGLGILGWATNLHGLSLLGVDVVTAMDLRDVNQPRPMSLQRQKIPKTAPDPYVLYHAAYRIFWAYSGWCLVSWLAFRYLTYGNPLLVDVFGYIPGISALVVLLILICPFNIFHRRERDKFLQYVPRLPVRTPLIFSFKKKSRSEVLILIHGQPSLFCRCRFRRYFYFICQSAWRRLDVDSHASSRQQLAFSPV